MMTTPTALQRIVLWHLATTSEGIETPDGFVRGYFPCDDWFSLSRADRLALQDAGWIEVTTQRHPVTSKQAMFLHLTPDGREWLTTHVDEELTFGGPAASRILHQTLKLMRADHGRPFVKTSSWLESLAEAQAALPPTPPARRAKPSGSSANRSAPNKSRTSQTTAASSSTAQATNPGRKPRASRGGTARTDASQAPATVNGVGSAEVLTPTAPDLAPEAVEARVQVACLALGRGRENVRIRLTDLRTHLADVPRADVDAALTRLADAKAISLYPFDDRSEITPDDEAAAYITQGGNRRYIVYYGGSYG